VSYIQRIKRFVTKKMATNWEDLPGCYRITYPTRCRNTSIHYHWIEVFGYRFRVFKLDEHGDTCRDC